MADVIVQKALLYRYSIPLKNYMPQRDGLVIELIDDSARSYFAEAAPLTGRSKESIEKVEREIKNLLPLVLGKSVSTLMGLTLSDTSLAASVSFALFGALHQMLYPYKEISCPISALLMGSYDKIKEDLHRRRDLGMTHVKLKTSNLSPAEAKKIVAELMGRYTLRIDLNRSWSASEVREFFSCYENDVFDYVEEPGLCDIAHPIALDETLVAEKTNEALMRPNVKALVIKPTILGMGPSVHSLIDWGRKNKKTLSLSSSFETGLGLYQIALAARFFDIDSAPLGLDTYRYLTFDILQNRHMIKEGKMYFSAPHIDRSLIDKGVLCLI